MKIHDHIPSIATTLIMFIMFIFMILIVKECHAWTGHEFQARLSGGNAWKITSLPEAIYRSEEYDMAGKLGYLSYVYIVREDGKWDPDLMYMGPIAMDKEAQSFAKSRIMPMVRAIDKILPNEEMIVISFAVDYVEMFIFFDPVRWKNKEFHVGIAKKLNIERTKWRKSATTN